ncbi:MAG: flagellar filament capping protein FliD [Aliifodinibius sp.]|nr:flagellar filament capping protein FliD [Fodinibius sp.]
MISPLSNSSIESLMQNFRHLEEQPIRTLESRKTDINDRIGLFNKLKTKLSSFESLVTDLGYSGLTSVFGQKAATSSDETIATVTASSSALASSHTLSVSQLAKADKVVSNQYTLSGTGISSTLGAGSYTFDVTIDGTTTQVSLGISSGEDNETVLNNIITAVNNQSDIGIRASLIKDSGTTGRLVFTSENTGADYEMGLSDSSGSLLATIGMNDSVQSNGTSGGYIYHSSELNAQVTIDGISVQSNSNTLEDAISGLTVTLHKTQESGAAPVTLNVTNDVEGIKAKLEEFVEAYNKVVDFVKTNSSVNTNTFKRSAFSGDFSITNLRFQLREQLTTPVTGLGSDDPRLLSQIGFSIDRNGKLSISDTDQLEDIIRDNLDQVEQLFNSSDGYSARLSSILDEMTSGTGLIEQRKDVLQSQITRLNNRIELMRKSVDKKLENYRNEFAQLQAAMAQFNSQSNYLTTLSQSFGLSL